MKTFTNALVVLGIAACLFASSIRAMERHIKIEDNHAKELHITRHAEERMIQRGISGHIIAKILSTGIFISTRGNSLKFQNDDTTVITDAAGTNVITVYKNGKNSGGKTAWQGLTSKQREKIMRAIMKGGFRGDDLVGYFHRLCAKNRDIAKRKARDLKKKM